MFSGDMKRAKPQTYNVRLQNACGKRTSAGRGTSRGHDDGPTALQFLPELLAEGEGLYSGSEAATKGACTLGR